MIVGVASGLPVETLRPWCASARRVWTGPLVLLTDTPAVYQPLETAYEVELRPAILRTSTEGICGIARTRWLALADHLSPTGTDPIVFVDTRDAVFQANPLAPLDGKLRVGSEGKTHAENAWCAGWLHELRPDWTDRLAHQDVLNAGAIGGPESLVREFALALYHQLPVIPCGCTAGATHMTDQTLLNILARSSYAAEVEITTDWVFHVRAQEHARIPATWQEDRKQLLRADGYPFPIIHQWDLAPQLQPWAAIR